MFPTRKTKGFTAEIDEFPEVSKFRKVFSGIDWNFGNKRVRPVLAMREDLVDDHVARGEHSRSNWF